MLQPEQSGHFLRCDKGVLTMRLLLLLIALIGGVALSQAAEKKNEDQKTVKSNAAAKNQNGTNTLPTVINVAGNTQSIENTCNPTNCNKEPENGWWEKLWTDPIATFTGALFLATAALIGTGVVQWLETRSTARKELRAYVALAKPYFVEATRTENIYGKELVTYTDNLKIRIENYGKTPSLHTEIFCSSHTQKPTVFAAEGPRVGKQMLHPGMGYNLEVTDSSSPRHIQHGWIWGHIIYQDIYDRWWRTNFFYAHHPQSIFTPETEYNDEQGDYPSRNAALEGKPTT